MAQVGVTALSHLEFLVHVMALSSKAVVISLEAVNLVGNLCVHVSGAGQLSLALVKLVMLVTQLVVSLLNQSVKVVESGLGAGNLSIQVIHFVGLMASFVGLLIGNLLQSRNLSEHLSTLYLNGLDVGLNCIKCCVVMLDLVTLGHNFFLEAGCFIGFLVEGTSGTLQLIHRLATDLSLLCNKEFELLKRATGICDFVASTVESQASLVLSTGFVIRKHAVAVLHVENLIIDTSIVTGLASQVVELLAELGNELIFL